MTEFWGTNFKKKSQDSEIFALEKSKTRHILLIKKHTHKITRKLTKN